MRRNRTPPGLADPQHDRASCGVGVVVDLRGRRRHDLVEAGLTMLANLAHRGARGAEEGTGDGAGMLLQKPHDFLAAEVAGLPGPDAYGIGQAFLPREARAEALARRRIEALAAQAGFELVAWRVVPTDAAGLGRTARASEPAVRQFFVVPRGPLDPQALDAGLYLLRRRLDQLARQDGAAASFHVCSLDRRRLVYKGLLTAAQLRTYYPELSDPRVVSALVLVHSRFSTNTMGAWPLAHPYRCTVHNGEFNTLRGNKNWMRAREPALASPRLGADLAGLGPLVAEDTSDSATFDSVLELLLESGRSLPHALRMMIPEAWRKDERMAPARRAFYDFHATLMEPWDGPALVVASDGEQVAAVLDRNGLRPCRLWVTDDDWLVLGSETGLLDIPVERIVRKGRLGPGQLLLADTRGRGLVAEDEVFASLTAPPYASWLAAQRIRLADRLEAPRPDEARGASAPTGAADDTRTDPLQREQGLFGYTLETLRALLLPMADEGKDPLGAMGNDTPPAALSGRARPLFHYFTQLFAQVSNPPIDYLREALVTDLGSHLGRQRNLLDATPAHCHRVFLDSPVLTAAELAALGRLAADGIHARTLDLGFSPGQSLAGALEALRQAAERAVKDGCEIIILSDRATGPSRLPIPSLLATGAVHHHLLRKGLRIATGLVVDSGEPCLVHHFCTLFGYGADAVHPWLAWRSVDQLVAEGVLDGDAAAARQAYRKAVEGGLLKVMAKMGISTLEGYKGAQVFEAVGLDPELVDACFAGTPCAIPGLGLEQIERELRARHRHAFDPAPAANLALEQGGEFYWRRDGEIHQWNPLTIGKLQQAAQTGDEQAYRQFASHVNEQDGRLQTLRGLLEFVPAPSGAVAVDEVEPEEAIMRRFATGSMSFGSLSREAHEALAVAMNRIGGKSGTGEGGEHPDRFGSERECSMKQVASGRFGVSIQYLAHARQIEIKMAQGAKPGEGGELPAGKVDEGIAAARGTTPGVGLISPPPHHDIYSIEDLAQLIHDLKCANPQAEIHVKLVAEAGVGTIAAGVAKARADAILISGDSGGTGASVKTSIKSAGSAWELGLAEAQQVLLANRLRSRISLRVDGGLKTGRDVVVAALLGAEEFGFGTAPLVTLGCIMLRKCHCNTCSVGVATQDPRLRGHFGGKPEYVINYLRFVAREVRELMATMGFRTVDEMVGRVDCLRQRSIEHPRGLQPDLSRLLHRPRSSDSPRRTRAQEHGLEDAVDHALVRAARPALEHGTPVSLTIALRNRNRAVGTMLSGVVAGRCGPSGLPADTITIRCRGSAGQSFGAFLAPGIGLHLEGDANDYVGKGLSGGRISIATPSTAGFVAAGNTIIGNVALYGASAGEAYFNGLAGERFGVRNSGALAVVEGVGDHGCEYMTGGVVLVLGSTGRNFGAGMSGGEAYVLDEPGDFRGHVNTEMVAIERVSAQRDRALVRRLLENHLAWTGSSRARAVLQAWDDYCPRFVKVMPRAFAAMAERALREGRDVRPPLPPRVAGVSAPKETAP